MIASFLLLASFLVPFCLFVFLKVHLVETYKPIFIIEGVKHLQAITDQAFTCSNSTMETQKQCMKYIQSIQ